MTVLEFVWRTSCQTYIFGLTAFSMLCQYIRYLLASVPQPTHAHNVKLSFVGKF
jgi:hypothetical protein